jgi:peptidoglycan/xylan/chitin deacetylase (PgdA/CDA1 family)
MLRSLKLATLRALQNAGVFSRIADSRWRQDRLLILCYHGISLEDEHLWDPDLYMAPQQFAARMRLLEKNKCTVLQLEEGLQRLYARNLPPRSVVLTFDDGSYDFYAQALPVLQKYGFPATVYLTTYYCTHGLPVFNVACRYILWKQRGVQVPRDTKFALDLDLRDSYACARTFRVVLRYCEERGLSGHEKHSLLEVIAQRLGFDFDRFMARRTLQLLTPQETAGLAAAGIDFQLHTHRHCTPNNPGAFQTEVEENRSQLRRITGSIARHFCYPSGVIQPRFLPWLQTLGVLSATTCEQGLAGSSTSPYLLPRHIDASGSTEWEFEGWLSGVSSLLSRQAFQLSSTPEEALNGQAIAALLAGRLDKSRSPLGA